MNYKLEREHFVPFGKVDGEDRGDEIKLMDPPLNINDQYYWLRSDDRSDKDVLDLLNRENAITEHVMKDKSVEDQLFEEMKSRVLENESSHPYKFYDTGYLHYTKYVEGKGQAVYCRKVEGTNQEDILVDVNELAKGHSNCDVIDVTTSYDGKILTYAVDYSGNEQYDIYFKDLTSGHMLPNKLKNLLYADYVWSPTNRHIYYIGHDDANRMNKLCLYDLETQKVQVLFEEKDTLFSVGVSLTDKCYYIMVNVSSANTSEQYYIDQFNAPTQLQLIKKRQEGVQYGVEDYDQTHFIIRTNADGDTNFKLMVCHKNDPSNWQPFIPYDPDKYITGVTVFENFIVVSLRTNGLSRIGYVMKKNVPAGINILQFDEEVYCVDLSCMHNLIYRSNEMVFTYESMVNPYKLLSYNVVTKEYTILKKKEVPNYDPSLYESKLILVPSHDGKEIPVSMLYRKDMFRHYNKSNNHLSKKHKTETQPMLLYGYGAYGICIEPGFRSTLCSLLDRSFIYCVANVRGGSEKGYDWYLDGKMKNKINTFKDFISCAEYMINNGYTSKDRLAAEGRSAGGLLVGAVLTMKPDLFNTVILGVPFVDALVTMSDPSIPLVTPEWEEWGNPNIEEYYQCMKEYTPMENIQKRYYPDTLITCGLFDPRVQYWESAKFQLRLKDKCTDQNTHLIKIDMDKGHFSNTDRYKSIRECAFKYAFILKSINYISNK